MHPISAGTGSGYARHGRAVDALPTTAYQGDCRRVGQRRTHIAVQNTPPATPADVISTGRVPRGPSGLISKAVRLSVIASARRANVIRTGVVQPRTARY